MSVLLNEFQIIKPTYCVSQQILLNWLIKCHQAADEKNTTVSKTNPELISKLFNHYSVNSAQVSQRFFECDDILSENFEEHNIYKINNEHHNGINIKERMLFFSDKAFDVIKKFYKQVQSKPNHLIHVTCTGYISPSAAQKIVCEENWNQDTEITHAYHMGCYAAFPAVRMAGALVISESLNNDQFKTDIVHNELCSLHMSAETHSPEQMVVQTLFADGHIKYSVSKQSSIKGQNLKVITILEKIIPDSTLDMSWIPGPFGMQMSLSRAVPAKIKMELKKFADELLKNLI
jgi:predicted naringenin-chalcone synthase